MKVGDKLESLFTGKQFPIMKIEEYGVWINFGKELGYVKKSSLIEGNRYQSYKIVK
jgi:hypothetical protein